jgi:predicted transcriptional regulator
MPILGKDYQPGIQKRIFQAKQTIETEFPGLWKPTEACLSVFAQLKIKDIANCTFLTFIGSPASRKTTMLSWFHGLDCSYFTDDFSPTSFVSHYAGATEEELKEKIDLLPRVKGKVLITPELMPAYSASYEELNKNLGIITRVLDGQGYSRDSGVHGQRGYKGIEGEWVFHWLAGIAYVPYRLWRMFGNMGTRAYYYGMPEENNKSSEELAKELKEDFPLKSKTCRKAIQLVINYLWDKYPEQVEWQKQDDNIETLEAISKLAILLSSLRGNIELQYEEEGEDAQEVYTQPVIEQPHRANQVLYNLARGHALLYGRRYITNSDLPLIVKVALDSARTDRVKLFRCLLDKNGVASSKDFEQYLNISRTMAIRTMMSLKILGLINISKNNPSDKGGRPMYLAQLKDEFKWFLSQEFKALWRE